MDIWFNTKPIHSWITFDTSGSHKEFMDTDKSMESTRKYHWTIQKEEKLIALWGQHDCLYDRTSMSFHDKLIRDTKWMEIADELNIPVKDVKHRAGSIRAQYSRILKPHANSGKPLTAKQLWFLDKLEFLRRHYVPRLNESSLNLAAEQPGVKQEPVDVVVVGQAFTDEEGSFSDMSANTLDSESVQIAPEQPDIKPGQVDVVLDQEFADEDASFSDMSENTVDSVSVQQQSPPKPPQSKKRKGSDSDTEVEAINLLRKMSATVMTGLNQANDSEAIFGQQIASDLREIQNPVLRRMAKRKIQMLVYEYQDKDQFEREKQ
ncbi:uncharacterized protein LOC127655544 isoform X2 [Xyrauchen texanus]|uniref:uncharacterized protein LOC127655544 isoform X2 n=1 Tax=Xyrauchen texanus TaxID=154827 RepID=UPI002241D1D5|nr:uncharacterized protein LOC127655544 isoform X2 [Xyrauchen texanus]